MAALRSDSDQNKIGYVSMKKHSHPRTNEDNGDKKNKDYSMEVDRKKKRQRCGDPNPPSQNRFVTLTVTNDSLINCRLHLPLQFMRENGLNKPGMITLLDRDGKRWPANRIQETTGRMKLGKGWKDFAEANGFKMGESFILESIWEESTPTLSLSSTDSSSDRRQRGDNHCSKASEKESDSHSGGNKTKKAKNDGEKSSSRKLEKRNKCRLPNRKDQSLPIQSRLVKLTLELEDVRAGKLHLPSQVMEANGINRLGKIIFLGKNRMKWKGYLLSRDGTVALGSGWKGFCEANGVKTGVSFILEFVYERDSYFVFKLCSNSRD